MCVKVNNNYIKNQKLNKFVCHYSLISILNIGYKFQVYNCYYLPLCLRTSKNLNNPNKNKFLKKKLLKICTLLFLSEKL